MLNLFGRRRRERRAAALAAAASTNGAFVNTNALGTSGGAVITPPEPQIAGRRRFSFSFDALPATPPTPILPDAAFKIVPDADEEVRRVCVAQDGIDINALPSPPDSPGPPAMSSGAPDTSALAPSSETAAPTLMVTPAAPSNVQPFMIEDAADQPVPTEENVMTKMFSMLGRRRKSVDVWAEQDLYDESEVRTTLPGRMEVPSPTEKIGPLQSRRLAVFLEPNDPTPLNWAIKNVVNASNDLVILVNVRSSIDTDKKISHELLKEHLTELKASNIAAKAVALCGD
ncbi:hypothetical protein HDU97_006466 [Phlyctochytrium planicorne]|nr:hypothetical protein HDU97_006466 [Phlyctochytrium planicorne]